MKQQEYKVRKRKLIVKTTIQLVGVFVVTMAVINLIVGFILQREILKIYKDFSFSYTDALARNIEPDKVHEYMKTGKTDEYYTYILKIMQGMVSTSSLRYLYVFIPTEEGVHYVWDAQADDDSRPLLDTWYYDGDYPEEEAFKAYRTGEKQFTTYSYGDIDLSAAMTPIKDKYGRIVALVEADILMPSIRSGALRILISLLGALFVIMVLSMSGFYAFVRGKIINPLININTAVDQMVENIDSGRDVVIDVDTGDEIEMVARSIEGMNRELIGYIRENNRINEEKQRVSMELDMATKLQADMLPNIFPAFPDRKEINIYADMTPAKEVGGDFYDFFFTDHDHLAIVMADVSEKGVPAAMFMMMAKSMIQSRTILGGDPGTILEDVNNMICSNNRERMFVTVWLGILDVRTGVLTAANAGHEKPVLKSPDGGYELINDEHGFVIGGKKKMKYANYELKMEPGSMLFVYTDGVPEATNEREELFGVDRMLKTLNEHTDAMPDDILMYIDRDVYWFIGNAEQFDDVTMLCLRYNGA